MTSDGALLASIEHPLDVEHVNAVAKVIDAHVGLCQPGGWTFCLQAAEATIRASMAWQAAHVPDDIDPASLVETTIDLPTRGVVKQAVTVRGIRTISRRELADIGAELAITRATFDLQHTFDVWLWINAPVFDWRYVPRIESQRDYLHDRLMVQIYARGWLDIDVRLADHQAWLVELP